MDRVRKNLSNFKFPRLAMEQFTFTTEEEATMVKNLNKLESMLSKKAQTIFSVSKIDALFSGSLKINSLDIYTHGKASSAIGLFCKLRKRVEIYVRHQNKILKTEKIGHLET